MRVGPPASKTFFPILISSSFGSFRIGDFSFSARAELIRWVAVQTSGRTVVVAMLSGKVLWMSRESAVDRTVEAQRKRARILDTRVSPSLPGQAIKAATVLLRKARGTWRAQVSARAERRDGSMNIASRHCVQDRLSYSCRSRKHFVALVSLVGGIVGLDTV